MAPVAPMLTINTQLSGSNDDQKKGRPALSTRVPTAVE